MWYNCTYNAKDMGSKPFLNYKSVNSISIGYLHHLIATLYSTEVVTNQSRTIYLSMHVCAHYNQLAIPGYKTASETGHTQPLFYVILSTPA